MRAKWSEVGPYLTPSALHLIVMPTEQCNLRCTYCYEDFALKQMTPETVDGLLRLIERRAPRLDQLSLDWFGGEPLLAYDIVKTVQARAQRLERLHPTMNLRGSMTTNAVLLDPERLAGLVDLGVTEYQITLDGVREQHDRKRVHAGGQPTFDRIWGHLVAARCIDRKYEILVRVHVDRDNIAAMPRFIDEYEDAFGGDPRFNLWFRPLSCFGGPNDSSLPVLRGEDDAARLQSLRRRAVESGLHRPMTSGRESVCYASYGNAFVVRADGTIGKCTIALSDPKNAVGRLLPDGTVRIDAAKMKPWLRGLFSRDAREMGCPMTGFADDTAGGAGKMNWLRVLLWIVAVTLFFGADSGRAQDDADDAVTPIHEIDWGEEHLEAFLQQQPRSADEAMENRLQHIGRLVAEVASPTGASPRFMVVVGDEAQAFTFYGGTICVTEGLLRLLDDDELAFAVGHELSHSVLRHSLVMLRMERLFPKKFAPSPMLTPLQIKLMQSHEREADRFGALYAVRAGFPFTASLTTLEKLETAGSGQTDLIHPEFRERRAELEEFRVELVGAIEAFDLGLDALESGEHDEAILYLRMFVGEFPNSVPGRINLGVAYLAKIRAHSGLPGGMAEVLPTLPEPGIVLRDTLSRAELMQARDEFKMALRLQAGHPLALAGWALVLLRLDEIDAARDVLAQALEAEPENPEIALCAGNAAYLAGDFESAERLYRRALEIRAKWSPAEDNLVRLAKARSEASL